MVEIERENIRLSGDLASEEAMDLSKDRIHDDGDVII